VATNLSASDDPQCIPPNQNHDQCIRLLDDGRYQDAAVLAETLAEASVPSLIESERSRDDLRLCIRTFIENGEYEKAEEWVVELAEAENAAGAASKATALLGVEVLLRNGRFAEAEEKALGFLEWSEQETSSLRASALRLVVEALGRHGAKPRREWNGIVDRAIEANQAALVTEKKIHGPEDLEVAERLHVLALLIGDRDPEQARPLCDRALLIRKSALRANHPKIAESLQLLGRIDSKRLGQPAGRAPALASAALAPPPLAPPSRSNIRSCFDRALAIRRQSLRADHPLLVETLNYLAATLIDLGKYEAARPLYEEALAIWERSGRSDDPQRASTLRNVATFEHVTGHFDHSRKLFNSALAIQEQTLGSYNGELASTLENLGLLEIDYPDNARAAEHLRRAWELWCNSGDPTDPYVRHAQASYGVALIRLGDYERAREILNDLLKSQERLLGRDHHDNGVVCLNLARIFRETGRREDARDMFDRVVCLAERVRLVDPPPDLSRLSRWETCALLESSELDLDEGHFDLALTKCRRALDVRVGEQSPDLRIAWAWAHLAKAQHCLDDLQEAQRSLECALSIEEKFVGLPRRAIFLEELAAVLADAGRPTEALERALAAEQDGRKFLEMTVRILAERTALDYAGVRPSGLDLALSLAVERRVGSDAIPRVWDALIRCRALVLDEMVERKAYARTDPRLAAALAATTERMANLVISGRDRDPEEYAELLRVAQRDHEAVELELAKASSSFRPPRSQRTVGLSDLIAAMPERSALVAYVQYGHYQGPRKKCRSYAAFVCTKRDARPVVTGLGPADAIDDLVSKWREGVAEGALANEGSPAEREAAYRAAGQKLRKAIWDPVVPHIAGVERVFVVPDARLNLVNLSTLPINKTHYLVECGPVIHHLGAERDLIAITEQSRRGHGLLAVGDPDFNVANPRSKTNQPGSESSAPRGVPLLQFGPLPHARLEAQLIGQLAAGITEDGGNNVLVLTQGEAEERRFKELSPGREMLHLATHGFFFGPQRSLSRRGDRGLGACVFLNSDGASAAVAENPLLRSGLAFAGANSATWSTGEDDGVLTAQEVADLDLSGVQWVVLSACETGLGTFEPWEGVLGLDRAFKVAGARTVIMSLWSVDDDLTRQWMVDLYKQRLINHRHTDEAVQQASQDLLDDRREAGQTTHPFYWGAFIAAGDWK
jgi:CHAT domain-containing protein/tetratricopeptide (TPR) repeat protein